MWHGGLAGLGGTQGDPSSYYIYDSYNTGTVTPSSGGFAGGLVGRASSNYSPGVCYLKRCYNSYNGASSSNFCSVSGNTVAVSTENVIATGVNVGAFGNKSSYWNQRCRGNPTY